MAMAYDLFLLLLAVVAPTVHGVDHTVGGSDGWSQSADLATWAAGETFTVGDNLLFSYGKHSLALVSKDDYDKCATSKALKTFNDGQTRVPLLEAGPMYFVCLTSSHCNSDMKLAITVGGTSTTTPPGTATTTGDATTTPPGTATTTGNATTTPPGTAAPGGDTSLSGSASDGSTDGTTTVTSSTKKDSSRSKGRFGRFERIVVAETGFFMG